MGLLPAEVVGADAGHTFAAHSSPYSGNRLLVANTVGVMPCTMAWSRIATPRVTWM